MKHPRPKPFASVKRPLSSTARGYGVAHQQWRAEVLARYPICAACGKARATQADHIIAIADGGARYDVRNGQGLCHRCHAAKTGRETRERSKP